MFQASKRISGLVQSDIRAMTIECNRLNGINLGQGLCETETPNEVIEAAKEAISTKKKSIYSSPEGVGPLRAEIADKLKRENKIEVDKDTEVIVTNGATGGYAATLMALMNPGDGLLIFEPYYGYHVNAALLAEVVPQYIPFESADQKVSVEQIEACIQDNTKAIVVCTPNNPSGKMWTEEEINALATVAEKHNLLVITDEMYEYFRYDGREHISPASHPKLKDRSVSLMGLSKTFSITGWRLGYLSAPAEIANKIRLANDLFYVCAPTPLQHGVAAGFRLDPQHFKTMQSEFKDKRDLLCEALDKAGMKPWVPEGAYYILADIEKFNAPDSKVFAMSLLESAGVATIPGRAFFSGPKGENFIRANFAVNDDVLKKACTQISQFKGSF